MRVEYFADSRDIWKWTVVTQAALQGPRSIHWVTMLRDHVQDRQHVPNACPKVDEFFQEERKHLDKRVDQTLGLIRRLCKTLCITLEINTTPYPSSLSRRRKYIQEVVSSLESRPPKQRDVVLLDPDNGVGTAKGPAKGGMQIHEDHVALLWNALKCGDILAIVQFKWNEQDWVQNRQATLTRLLGIASNQVIPNLWSNLCVYTANR